MKFENTEVFNFEGAFRGLRNPMNSWNNADSIFQFIKYVENAHSDTNLVFPFFEEGVDCCKLGENDLKLAQSLIKAGSEHRKFMRQIFCSVDITAPLFWWKEFDTYKVGTVANSTSTMHKLASTPITRDCFEMDDFSKLPLFDNSTAWEKLIFDLEKLRKIYNETKDKRYWKELIRLLPESWLQKRTITMNYENIYAMIRQRKNHKLSEWSKAFIEWAESLPYAKELLFI